MDVHGAISILAFYKSHTDTQRDKHEKRHTATPPHRRRACRCWHTFGIISINNKLIMSRKPARDCVRSSQSGGRSFGQDKMRLRVLRDLVFKYRGVCVCVLILSTSFSVDNVSLQYNIGIIRPSHHTHTECGLRDMRSDRHYCTALPSHA